MGRLFAFAFSETVTVVEAPGASVPAVAESVTHGCVFAAVQLIEPVPRFLSV
jgi:hypothetical protein